MKKTGDFLAGFFHGKQSMTRAVLLIATVLFWGPLAYIMIVTKSVPKMDIQVVSAYALVVGGKAAQNYFDKKSTTPAVAEVPKTP